MASTPPRPGKKSQCAKVHMDDGLYLTLARLADADHRSVSDYCHMVLSNHAFGHAARLGLETEEPAQPNRPR